MLFSLLKVKFKEMKVIVLGSINIDRVFNVDHMVREGETLSSNSVSINFGGKGANQASSLSKAKMDVLMAGVIGHDGRDNLKALKKANVDVSLVQIREDIITGNAFIQVNKKAQNSIILDKGANFCLTKEYIDMVYSKFDKAIIVLQNEINLVDYAIKKAKEKNFFVVFNPSPFDKSILDYPLDLIDLIFVNEVEVKELVNEDLSIEDSLRLLIKKYKKTSFICTLGKEGAIFANNDNFIFSASIDSKVLDTTAAGDTFTGFFLRAYFNNQSIEDALLEANIASSITVSKKGALDTIPDLKDVLEKKSKLSNHN